MKEKDNFVNEVYVNAFFDYESKLNNNSKTNDDISVYFKRKNAEQ